MKFSSIVSAIVLGCFGTSAVSGQSIAEVVGNDTELSTLYAAVGAAGYVDPLTEVEMTLFAPTDAAFAALDQNLVATLLTPPYLTHLQALLSNHVVLGVLESSNITEGLVVESQVAAFSPLGIGPLWFNVTERGVFVGGPGFGSSEVIDVDILADNGVIHKVDQVMVPAMLTETLWAGLSAIPEGFDILKALLESTELWTVADGTDPITIFAPPDDVLAAIPSDQLAAVNATEVLLNHVVFGVFPTTLLTTGSQVTTALGINYTVTVSADGTISIGDVPVLANDFPASNGIAHVINGVLFPPDSGITNAPIPDPTPAPTTPEPTPSPVEGGETPSPVEQSPSLPTMMPSSSATAIRCSMAFVALAFSMML